MNNLPNKNTYYVLPNVLLAGEYPGSSMIDLTKERIKHYLKCGVNFYIDLTEENELQPYEKILILEAEKMKFPVEYHRMSIRDLNVPEKGLMIDILNMVDNAISMNKKVYVHCWGGVGRTGTVVGCHLVRHGKTGEEALKQIAIWWQKIEKNYRHPKSPETKAQCDYIRSWNEN
jgi:protein-tyrosine phosphatase